MVGLTQKNEFGIVLRNRREWYTTKIFRKR